MKQNTKSTPFLFSLQGGGIHGISSVEWSPKSKFDRPHHSSRNVEISPSPSISPTATRRVSTISSSSSNASSSGLSCISSSDSSTSLIGFRTYDDTDDTADSTSSIGEDDPILSFEALSLDTPSVDVGSETITLARAKTITQTKTVLVEEEQDQISKKGNTSQRTGNRMNHQSKKKDRKDPPIDFLSLASSSQEKDRFALSRRTQARSFLSSFGTGSVPKKAWENDNSEIPSIVPCAIVSNANEEQRHQPRRTMVKKYTVKKPQIVARSTSAPASDASRALRPKRQRGGSDFTMASASGAGDDATNGNNSSSRITSPLNRRKRRRINRNRAMAADDFDSILLQINTAGSS